MREVLLLALMIAPVVVAGGPVASLSTNRIHIGDRVELVLAVRHDAGVRVMVPDITRPPWIIRWESRSSTTETGAGAFDTTTHIVFSSFVIGEHRISTNHIRLLNEDGSEKTIPFPELVIRVDSVLTNPPPELSDIKPPVKLGGIPWLRTAGMVLLMILLAALAAWAIRHRLMQRRTKPAARRTIPPHEIALTALDALLKRQLIEQRASEAFYVELSAIVRVYLEGRFNLRAPEQTTEEFIRASAESRALSPEHRALTQSFLEESDLVKFARFEPEADDMRRAWDVAARLVRETVPATPSGAAT